MCVPRVTCIKTHHLRRRSDGFRRSGDGRGHPERAADGAPVQARDARRQRGGGLHRGAAAAIVGAAADASILSLPAALGDDDALDVLNHDVVVWQGDLNYRLASTKAPEAGLGAFLASFGPAAREAAREDDARDDAAVREALAAGDWAALAARDQLDAAIARGDAFVGFREAPKQFPPTYKLVRGTAEYKANRRPAWCDRVLWKAKRPSDVVACGRYASVATCVLSDHHPVSADLAVEFH